MEVLQAFSMLLKQQVTLEKSRQVFYPFATSSSSRYTAIRPRGKLMLIRMKDYSTRLFDDTAKLEAKTHHVLVINITSWGHLRIELICSTRSILDRKENRCRFKKQIWKGRDLNFLQKIFLRAWKNCLVIAKNDRQMLVINIISWGHLRIKLICSTRCILDCKENKCRFKK